MNPIHTHRRRGGFGALFLVLSLLLPRSGTAEPTRYPSEPDWIEVVFAADSRVRLRDGALTDLGAPSLSGVDRALERATSWEWRRLCHLSEEAVDAMRERGVRNTGRSDVPDLNNVYRLHVDGADVWEVSAALEALPGVSSARPVPKPVPPPIPPAYVQEYRAPAAWTPSGMGFDYFALAPNGSGAGMSVCDIEYAWNETHADITKAVGSQINMNVVNPFADDNHGTAVIGMLSADDNGWGVTGLCKDATLFTCGAFFGAPTPTWNPAGAILVAISHMPPGSVILLEQQWNYDDPNTPGSDLVPIEMWTDTHPANQSLNAVYQAIQLATANNQYVVEAAGNGAYDLNGIIFAGDSGAIVVGAGGVYPGGAGGAGNLERQDFSTSGFRVNVQGWGEQVITTGYGDLYVEGVTNDFDYTQVFNGTSSASAHVAAAVACYSAFVTPAVGALAPNVMRDRFILSGTPQLFGNPGHIGPRPDLMRLFAWNAPPVLANGGDFGDAPDGVLAYPNGVIGDFHTVFVPNRPPEEAMIHSTTAVQLQLGRFLDIEYGGNGGLPFLEFYAYDADECQGAADLDDGLLTPAAYTIQGGVVTSCSGVGGDLGPPCGLAVWGPNIDIEVRNNLGVDAWLNVLVDWNQDGLWGGVDMTCGVPAPELAMVNVLVPPTGPTSIPLSALVPGLPAIQIGSLPGHVWARFTLTDVPLASPATWNGSLISGGWVSIPQGETEDYLLGVGGVVAVADAAPDGPRRPLAAFPNPFRTGTDVRFEVAAAEHVVLDVFDVAGRRVRRLVDGILAPGEQHVAWDGRNEAGAVVSPGVYFGRIDHDGVHESVRLTLTR